MPRFKTRAVLLIAVCLLAVGAVGAAQAATPSVTSAIKAQDKVLVDRLSPRPVVGVTEGGAGTPDLRLVGMLTT